MTPEETQKAEMTLVLIMHKLPSRHTRKQACKSMGVEWGEYQHLKQKYKRLLDRYDEEQRKGKKNVL